MKLALCLEFPIGQTGGTEVLVSELVRGFAEHHRVVLVSGDDLGSLANTGLNSVLAGHIPWVAFGANRERSLRLTEQLLQYQVELAHFHIGGSYGWGNRSWWACPIVYLAQRGVRCLTTNHGASGITIGYCGPQRSLLSKLALLPPAWVSKQVVLSKSQFEVAVSQHDYHALRRWYWPMRGKFRQIYHSRLREVQLHPNPAREKIVLCVGSLGFRKGQHHLVEAFSQVASKHPDWKLVLIGRTVDQPMLAQIEAIISWNNLQERVQLLPEACYPELGLWFKRAAVFAMPSLFEGFGLSLQEALAFGCACVGCRVGGIPEQIQDGGNGLLVEAGNTAQLGEALGRLMGDASLRATFMERGPKSILEKGMTVPKMIATYEALYQEALRGPLRRRHEASAFQGSHAA